jgi:hypothetical protein
MGRTHLPYSVQIDLIEDRLKKLRRSLRKNDQSIFDRLIRYARMQIQAGAMASSPNPFDSMAMSMLIELQRQIDSDRQEIQKIREDLTAVISRLQTEAPEDGNT